MPGRRIFLFANGDCHDLSFYRQQINPDDRVISVNGGSRHVLEMGLRPAAVVGDVDSIDPALRQKLEQLPLEWIRNPAIDQEQSGLEMALEYALSLRPSELLICGALGGTRVDHTLINLFLLILPFREGVPAKIIDERQTVQLVDRELVLPGQPGDYLSLFSLTPETTGVFTKGLKYPLTGETLYFASTLGLSNKFVSAQARVTVASGLLLAIQVSRP